MSSINKESLSEPIETNNILKIEPPFINGHPHDDNLSRKPLFESLKIIKTEQFSSNQPNSS